MSTIQEAIEAACSAFVDTAEDYQAEILHEAITETNGVIEAMMEAIRGNDNQLVGMIVTAALKNRVYRIELANPPHPCIESIEREYEND